MGRVQSLADLDYLDFVLAHVRVGACFDPRRCIVVGKQSERALLIPCSAQLDLYKPRRDFLIEESRPEFPATELTKTSFAIDGPVQEVEIERIRKVYGKLTGQLAKEFESWLG